MRINLTKKDIVNSIYMQIGFSKKISENLFDDILDTIIENLIIPTTKVNEDGTNSILSNISVDNSGKIEAIYGLDNEETIGVFALSSFRNENMLTQIGNNRYRFNQNVGAPAFGIAMQDNFGKIGKLNKYNAFKIAHTSLFLNKQLLLQQ